MYSSFDLPLPAIPTSDSGDYCVTFDAKFLPYILGALWILTEKDLYESDGVNSALYASNLLALFQVGSECAVPLPVGLIFNYASSSVPEGCLECDGATYLKATYPELTTALGAAYSVDATHFRVPDMRGRAAIGKGTGSGLTARTLDSAVGAETHTLTSAQIPAHTHNVTATNTNGAGGSNIARTITPGTAFTFASAANTGGDGSHNNMQPSRALGFCIVAR
jgi:microcystin-dependent protein